MIPNWEYHEFEYDLTCVWHIVYMKLVVSVNVCIFILHTLYTFGGKDYIARADEGKQGMLYIIFFWMKGPYCTGGWEKTEYCYIYIIYYWKKGPILHWRSAKTVLQYTYDDVILCVLIIWFWIVIIWHWVWWLFDTG